MVEDPRRRRVVLFGGIGDAAPLGDTWEWDGITWTNVTPANGSPPAREGHVMFWDPVRERVVLFGGQAYSLPTNDTWEWDGSAWTQRQPVQSPGSRTLSGAAWNASRRRGTVFAGSAVSAGSDSWEWDGLRWRVVSATTALPAVREAHIVAPLPDGSGIVTFGGASPQATLLDDVNRLRWTEAAGSYESCRTQVDDDGDGAKGCADSDCWSVCTPACPPGAPCDAAAPRCGDGTCNVWLENCRNCASDCTCGVRCGDLFCDAPETAQTCPGDCL